MPSFADSIFNRVETSYAQSQLFNRSLLNFNEVNWNDHKNRHSRYDMYNAYYHNEVYSRVLAGSRFLKAEKGYYPYIRGIYNPVSRQADLYVSKVFGGAIDFKNPKAGAIPLVTDNEDLIKDIQRIWKWSNWNTNKSNFVRFGTVLGDSCIKIVEDFNKEKVVFEVLDPHKIKSATFDSVGNVESITIEYFTIIEGKQFLYTEIIDLDSFSTFLDNKPSAIYKDSQGNKVSKWENSYGFIPVSLVKHKNVGFNWGGNAFFTQLNKIDEINDEASLLNDQIRKAIDVIWFFAGAAGKANIEQTQDSKRDDIKSLYGPKDAKPHPMVSDINIEAALKNLLEMVNEIEKDMPELSLYKIRDHDRLTAPGIKAAYSDAIDRILEARVNYDSALIQANKMALAISSERGYGGISGYSLEDFTSDNDNLEHYIGERPIISDDLAKIDVISFLRDTKANPEFIWKQLGFEDNQLDDIKNPNPEPVNSLDNNANLQQPNDAINPTN